MSVVKSLAFVLSMLTGQVRRRDLRVLVLLLSIFVALVVSFSVSFHVLMEREGQAHSWATSVYWTLVTMTTLGFGDITFRSDAGRIFSVVVLLSGTIFLLVLLPFTFIQFVFVPWMAKRESARAPRFVDAGTEGHLVLTGSGPIERSLIRRADHVGVPYVVVVGELEEALQLHDQGVRVMVGSLDDPATYRAARVEHAVLVAATRTDTTNANITFTVREVSAEVPIVATATKSASVDILHLAGADQVLQLGNMLGDAMAIRALAPDGLSHVVGAFAGLLIAEARAASTSLAGVTLAEAALRARLGISILGMWKHGEFEIAGPDSRLEESSVLVLAGTREQLDAYDRCYATGQAGSDSALVIGGGRVGRAAGRAFAAAGTHYRVIEQMAERVRDPEHYILGDAADLEVLEAGGITDTTTVLITTHDDDVNIYLAIYCRRLRSDLRIVARANLDRNVTTLYRAGADDVLSYASTGATAIWNHFRGNDTIVLAEGLTVFRVPMPRSLVGRSIADSHIRRDTGCNVVAIARGDHLDGDFDGQLVLTPELDLVLIGDADDEARFAGRFPPSARQRRRV